MFHKAVDVNFLSGTTLEVTFQDGKVKRYNVANLFGKYPQVKALKNRKLFLSGKLVSEYGIIWNDEIDVEVETIYEDGITVNQVQPINMVAADAVRQARAIANISQKELSERTGITQADISRIERGVSNPSVSTLERIAKALNAKLKISIE